VAKTGREVIETKSEDLLVKLTEEEVSAKARRMAERMGELDRHNEESKRIAGERGQRKATLEGEIRKLGEQVRERSEIRPVNVEVIADYKRSIVVEVRTDTDETISERAMRSEERQTTIPAVASVPQNESAKQIARRLYSEGNRPNDVGVEKVINDTASLCQIEAGTLFDALVEVAEEEGAKKAAPVTSLAEAAAAKKKGKKSEPEPEEDAETIDASEPETEE